MSTLLNPPVITEIPEGPALRADLDRIAAFLRRDFLMAWSYRAAFVSDAVTLFGQALLFAFVGRLVSPDAIPSVAGRQPTYVAYVTVGIALTGLLGVGITRLTGVIGSERFMGTLESVLLTPTRLTTLQVGWLAYDLLYVPLRTVVFLTIVGTVFGVHFELGGSLAAALFLVAFLPFVWGVGAGAAAVTLVLRRGGLVNGAWAFALTFTSGAYFPISFLPGRLAAVAELTPVALAVDGARQALLGGAGVGEVWEQLLLLIGWSVLTLMAGLWLFRRGFERELRSGGIGLY